MHIYEVLATVKVRRKLLSIVSGTDGLLFFDVVLRQYDNLALLCAVSSMAEQLPHKQSVFGSSPKRRTKTVEIRRVHLTGLMVIAHLIKKERFDK